MKRIWAGRGGSTRHRLTQVWVGALTVGLCSSAFAQDRGGNTAPATAVSEDDGLAAIVVTARKRQETLLDAPVAVTAIPSAELQAKNINTLADVAQFAPSISVSSFGGSTANRTLSKVIIRGMTPGYISTVSVFVNGAPLSGSDTSTGLVDGITDVSQVEVIKGPQSAYFGRSTFAGAVNLITKAPGNNFRATADFLYGSYDWIDARGSIEGPIVNDILSARVSARYYSIDGQYKNFFGPKRFNGQTSKSANAEISFRPSDNLTVRLFGGYLRQKDGVSAIAKFDRRDYNCNAGGAPAGQLNFICGTLNRLPESRLGQNTEFEPNFRAVLANPLRYKEIGLDRGGAATRIFFGTLNISYEIPSLGVTLTSLTAGDRTLAESIVDLGNVFVPTSQHWLTDTFRDSKSFTQELRLTSDPDRPFRWAIGGNYLWSRTGTFNEASSPVGRLLFRAGGPNVNRTPAAFFSAAYDFSPKWTLTAEGRYQSDQTEAYSRTVVNGQAVEAPIPGLKQTYRTFTPRIILQFKPAPRNQIFATYSEGVNPGLFNTDFVRYTAQQRQLIEAQTGAGVSAKPERLQNYELGYKGSLFDDRLQIVTSVYYSRWIDQIVNQFAVVSTGATVLTASTFSNAGNTTLKGVELELFFRATPHFDVQFSGSINDSSIREYSNSVAAALVGAPLQAPLGLYRGNLLPNYSKYNAAIGLNYEGDINQDLGWYARGDYIYKSGMYEGPANLAKTQDTHRVNLRIGLQKGVYRIEGFVDNLFDNRAYASIENNVDVYSPAFRDRVINAGLPFPRRFGVRLRGEF